jgi:hypothetical protein
MEVSRSPTWLLYHVLPIQHKATHLTQMTLTSLPGRVTLGSSFTSHASLEEVGGIEGGRARRRVVSACSHQPAREA